MIKRKGLLPSAAISAMLLVNAGFVYAEQPALPDPVSATEAAAEAETEATTAAEETAAPQQNAEAEDYGISAYEYLKQLTQNYPGRLNEELNRNEADTGAGQWIRSTLESFGYTVNENAYIHNNYTGTNYYVTVPGASDKIICIGAHYDCDGNTQGVDDNASGVGTLMELAQRFKNIQAPCTIQFVFFDNEELGGYVGSYHYIYDILQPEGLLDDMLCYINLDSIGAGDKLFAYGGVYEDDTLTATWPLQFAQAAASSIGITLNELPEAVAGNPDEDLAYRTPTRTKGSDHYYFMVEDIPYIYFEAALWCDEDGKGGNDDTVLTCHYQTADPAFASTGGQIMHTSFDNLEQLESLLPGRLKTNMAAVSKVITKLILEINENTPEDMAEIPYYETEPAATEAVTEEEISTAAEESTAEETTAPRRSGETITGNHSLIIILFSFFAAAVILIIAFVIYSSAFTTRSKKRRKKNLKKKKRTAKRQKFD